MTPAELIQELKRRGLTNLDERRLTDWRFKRLLPPLTDRGRGQARGKHYFWRHPKIVEQTITVYRLLQRKYPSDEATLAIWLLGFSVSASALKMAWQSRLGSLQLHLEDKAEKIVKSQGSEFFHPEDKVSALATQFARKLAKQYGIDFDIVIQPVIDAFGLSFEAGYVVDFETLRQFSDIAALLLQRPIDGNATIQLSEFKRIVPFLQTNMSFSAVQDIISSATESELMQAHKRWREILKIIKIALPEIEYAIEQSELPVGNFLAIGFGRLCVPTIVRFIRLGQRPQLDHTIREIREFISCYDVREIFPKIWAGNNSENKNSVALAELMKRLADIWHYQGFPFSLSPKSTQRQ
jgi:hypothetical protein